MTIAAILGCGTAAVLWILGGRNLSDWFPSIEQTIGRELYFTEKAKLMAAWPVMSIIGLFESDEEDDLDA
jgi:hypothetical protein